MKRPVDRPNTRVAPGLLVLVCAGIGCSVAWASGLRANAVDAVRSEAGEGANGTWLTPRLSRTSELRSLQRQRAAQLLWGRDPFVRSTTTHQVNGLTLSGILWDAATPMAIINGQTLRVGEECDGYRVVDITPSEVVVTDETQPFQLQIAP